MIQKVKSVVYERKRKSTSCSSWEIIAVPKASVKPARPNDHRKHLQLRLQQKYYHWGFNSESTTVEATVEPAAASETTTVETKVEQEVVYEADFDLEVGEQRVKSESEKKIIAYSQSVFNKDVIRRAGMA